MLMRLLKPWLLVVTSGQNGAIPSEQSSFTFKDVLADSLAMFECLSNTIDLPKFQCEDRASIAAIYQRCLLDKGPESHLDLAICFCNQIY